MARKPSLLQLYHIAHAYYMENKDQDTIAASIGLSRSQVSRLLDQARKAGMVKFEVNFPSDIDAEALAESLRDELGLTQVGMHHFGPPLKIIVPVQGSRLPRPDAVPPQRDRPERARHSSASTA